LISDPRSNRRADGALESEVGWDLLHFLTEVRRFGIKMWPI